jgi:molybdenum cofactor biosynthesis enzyme MoaA
MMTQAVPEFRDEWRRQKSAAFDLWRNSTARKTCTINLWGRKTQIYANANLSIYSAQRCNAACPFCVEELRPASRGIELAAQKTTEQDDNRYFEKLDSTLAALRPLNPTISITGGEPSKDPRLPRILRTVARYRPRKCTITTNGSGLFDECEGRRMIDWVAAARLDHLNISVAHPDVTRNARLMRLPEALSHAQLAVASRVAAAAKVRVRLSCVLLESSVSTLDAIAAYLEFAQSLGIDNVIFRQLMKTDPATHARNPVVRYSDHERVRLEPLLDVISCDPRFSFVRQVMGYYYYVEVWKFRNLVAVFEEADLAQLEAVKSRDPHTIHELVFHPNATLASTWQPWDGVLGPPDTADALAEATP